MRIWVLFTALSALSTDPEPIATDRPDFTETSYVVAKGTYQFETGFTHLRQDGSHETSGPEALLRFGNSARTELRFGMPDYVWPKNGPEGFGDAHLGMKIQLGPLRDGTGVALIPGVSVPVGREGVRSESWSPELKACWSRDIGDKSLSGMFAIAWTEEGGDKTTTGQHTLSLGIPLSDRSGMFLEHVLDLAENLKPQHTLHSGFVYQPTPNSQWDLHFGIGISLGAPDSFVGIGYSFRM